MVKFDDEEIRIRNMIAIVRAHVDALESHLGARIPALESATALADSALRLATTTARRDAYLIAQSETKPITPECPGPDCPMCKEPYSPSAMCKLCGAGCWNRDVGIIYPPCNHKRDERHRKPEWARG